MPTRDGRRSDLLRAALKDELAARGHQAIADRLTIHDGYMRIEVRLWSRDRGYVSTNAPAWDQIRAILDTLESDVLYHAERAVVTK